MSRRRAKLLGVRYLVQRPHLLVAMSYGAGAMLVERVRGQRWSGRV